MACKRGFWPRSKRTTSSGVILFSFFCVVVDGFLLWGTEHLHLYSSHYPLGTAVGGLSNSENPDEQLLRKAGRSNVAQAAEITAV